MATPLTLADLEEIMNRQNTALIDGLQAAQKSNNDQLMEIAKLFVKADEPTTAAVDPAPAQTLDMTELAKQLAALLPLHAEPTEPSEPPEPVQGDAADPAEEPAEPTETPAETEAAENAATIKRMADIAASQASFDEDTVRSLQIMATAKRMTADEYFEKLKSIQIQPNPAAALDTSEREFNIGNALVAMAHNEWSNAKYEQAVSNDILRKTNLGMMAPGTLAIPKAIIALNTTTGAASGAKAIEDRIIMMLRKDLPDPFNIMPFVTMLPSSAGEDRIAFIAAPNPAMVEEPGDTGYTKTGDATVTDIQIAPKIMVDKVLVSRLMNVQAPTFMSALFNILIAMMDETKTEQILMGAGATGATDEEINGIYFNASIGSSTDLSNGVADVTAAIIRAAMRASFPVTDNSKSIIMSPSAEDRLPSLAEPAAVGRFYEGGQVENFTVRETEYMQLTAGTKPARGLVGPLSQIYVKDWDDAVFVSRRYEDGNDFMVLENFFNTIVPYPEVFHRLRQD